MKRYLDFAPLVIALALILSFSSWMTPSQAIPDDNLSASLAVPTVVALFETSLASAISSSATSFTLTSAADLTGTALASSTYAFIIDEGTASQELVIADCTGTACANAVRGVSVITGTTTVTALEHSHRRGASVKITDGPQLNIISRIVNGIGTFPNVLSYTSAPTFSSGNQIINKTYADNLVITGGTAGSDTVPGIFLTGTQAQIASTTSSGTYLAQPYLRVIPASMATSSPDVRGLYVPVAQNDGYLKQSWLDLTKHWIHSSLFATNASSTNATTTSQYITGIVSKILKTDANGQVIGATENTDYAVPSVVLKDYTPNSVTMTNAAQNYMLREEYGVGTFTTLSTDSFRIRINTGQGGNSGTTYDQIIIGNGSASTTVFSQTQSSGYRNFDCSFDIFMKSATNSWTYTATCMDSNNIVVAVGNPAAGSSSVELASGFNVVASSTSSTQGGHTGVSDFLRVERIR